LAGFLRRARARAVFFSTSFFGTWTSAFITLSKREKGASELDRLSLLGMGRAYTFSLRA
jgi:hypothetical protein